MNTTKFEDQLFFRSLALDTRAIDKEKRATELSFSSEDPVRRWFGNEILLHGEKNVDLRRLRLVGSVLYGHNPFDIRNIIGPIKKVWVDSENRKCRAVVGFDEDETGELAMKKVEARSLRGVSMGYLLNTVRELKEGEEWTDPDTNKKYLGPALVATMWTPYEITLTPVPADSSVGFGRDATRSLAGIQILDTENNNISELDSRVDLFDDLMNRAAAISEDAQLKVADLLTEGRTALEVDDFILKDLMPKPDARDTKGPGEDGTGRGVKHAGQPKVYGKVDDLTDEEFTRMITNPAVLLFQ